MTRQISKYEKAVLGLYLVRLGYHGDAELVEFSFALEDQERRATITVARAELPTSSGDSLWFTGTLGDDRREVPSKHKHQFVGIYDSRSYDLSSLVGSAYHYDRCVSTLDYGHTFPLASSSPLRGVGYSSALILDVGVYRPLEGVNAEIGGIATSFFAVVPISDKELELKSSRGIVSLMEEWDREGRDILNVKEGRLS